MCSQCFCTGGGCQCDVTQGVALSIAADALCQEAEAEEAEEAEAEAAPAEVSAG